MKLILPDKRLHVTQKSLSAVLAKNYINIIVAQDVVDVVARSSEFTLIPCCLFPQFLRNGITPFKKLKFPSDYGCFRKLDFAILKMLIPRLRRKRKIEKFLSDELQ